MENRNKIEEILEGIITKARTQYCSYEDERQDVKEQTDNILKLLICDSSLKLEIKEKMSFGQYLFANFICDGFAYQHINGHKWMTKEEVKEMYNDYFQKL